MMMMTVIFDDSDPQNAALVYQTQSALTEKTPPHLSPKSQLTLKVIESDAEFYGKRGTSHMSLIIYNRILSNTIIITPISFNWFIH